MEKILVYDIEISTPLLEPEAKRQERSKEEQRKIFDDQGIKYAEGWRDFWNMQIACIAMCEMDLDGDEPDRYRVFAPDTFDRAIGLFGKASYIGGYNHKRFDNEVVKARFGIDLAGTRQYDVLEEIWLAKDLNPDEFDWKTHAGVGLDAMCEINFGQKKTGRGDRAPFLWLAKRYGEVMDYCLQDVWLTVRLIRQIMEGRGINDPVTRDWLNPRSCTESPVDIVD